MTFPLIQSSLSLRYLNVLLYGPKHGLNTKPLKAQIGNQIRMEATIYMNKRIDSPGILMSSLFRQSYGKITKELRCLIGFIIKELN